MIKKILLILILFSSINSFGQSNNFPDGVYLNIVQFKNRAPAYNINLDVIKRTSGDIFMMGGNDYKIKSKIDSINKSYINKKIFAYVKNDSVFLNCIQHKLQTWYALCNGSTGNYITFKACMSLYQASNIAMRGGGLGAGVAAKKRYLYVLNLTNGAVDELNEQTMSELLKNKPALLLNYKKNTDRDSEQILLEYINQLNLN